MTSTSTVAPDRVVVPASGLDGLFDALHAEGWPVVGPTVRDGVIAVAPITSAEDLPRMQQIVFDHIRRFAFREELQSPEWRPS